jgi:hypothetical protein
VQRQCPANEGGGGGFVEDVEVDTGDALGEKVFDLAGGVVGTGGELAFEVVAMGL